MSSAKEFVIKDGVLKKYTGQGGNVIIPEGVTEIGKKAFFECRDLTGAVIPDGVTSIGEAAFANCKLLTGVVIPESVTSIGIEAFRNCAGVTDIMIPAGVSAVSGGCFCGCTGLKRVSIPENVTSIGYYSFKDCISLESVVIPSGAIQINDGAFEACFSLKSVEIPKSVQWIGNDAFEYCRSLRELIVNDCSPLVGMRAFSGCKKLTDKDGFIISGTSLIEYQGSASSVVIPDGVETIWDHAFYNRGGFSVTFPESVKKIARHAFEFNTVGIRSLTVYLPSGLEEAENGITGFYCTVYAKAYMPVFSKLFKQSDINKYYVDDVLSLPGKYRPEAALHLITDGKWSKDEAVETSLKTYLKKDAGKLCRFAFDHTEMLHFLCENKLIPPKDIDVFFAEAEKRGDIENTALILSYKDSLGEDAITKAKAKKQKDKETYEATLLDRIAKRDPSKGIEGLTFVVTGWLREWPSRKDLKEYLESYGAKLGSSVSKNTDYLVTNDTDSGSDKNIKAAELGVEIISEKDFNHIVYRKFKDSPAIDIPPWVHSILKNAFNGCSSLTSITIPASVKSIGESAFCNCNSLTSITIPDGVPAIESKTFSGCSSLTSITIPASVKSIGDNAFCNCSSLESVEIPEGITSIERETFSGCSSLESVKIPESMTSVGYNAFDQCSKLKRVYITDIEKWCSIDFKDGSMGCPQTLFLNGEPVTDLIIPEGITKLKDYAFMGCDIKSITIHRNITVIGNSFLGCGSLLSINVDRDNAFYASEDGVLYNKEMTELIFYPRGKTGFFTVPSTVLRVCKYAFFGSNIESICIPESVTAIDGFAFYMSKLNNVVIPGSIIETGFSIFYKCIQLLSVRIQAGIKELKHDIFSGCSNLEDVYLPESITDIRIGLFKDCPKLKIHAPAGSYAEQYAKENNIPFVAE